MYFIRC